MKFQQNPNFCRQSKPQQQQCNQYFTYTFEVYNVVGRSNGTTPVKEYYNKENNQPQITHNKRSHDL